MKKLFPTTTILMLICILTATFSANAQLYEVSLDEKIEKANLIVEGKVVEQRSYCTKGGEIYTANKIAVNALLKGKFPGGLITVTTWGGEVNGETATWTHILWLDKGDEGIFFLERSKIPEIGSKEYPSPAFDVYSSSQGFLKFGRNDFGAWTASEPFHTYTDFPNEIYDCVAGKIGQKRTVISGARSEIRTGIRYLLKATSISGTTVNFEIKVNSLLGNKQLYNAGAALNYNPACFGANIATNGNLQLQAYGISANTVYSLTKSNLTSSKAKIELATTGSVTSLTTISTSEQVLAKGSLTIVDVNEDPDLTFDVAEMYGLSKYWADGQAYGFDTIIVETDFSFEHAAPDIIDFFPKSLAAGIWDTLTIVGTDFGATRGDTRVQFSNAHEGPDGSWVSPQAGEYVYWSDDTILVRVPSFGESGTSGNFTQDAYAGTGKFRVRKGFFPWEIASSPDDLEIRFCAINKPTNPTNKPSDRGTRTALGNYNGNGGYSLYYSKEFKDFAGATKAFERALRTWRCATQVYFEVMDSAAVAGQSNTCKISFDDLPIGTNSTTLGQTSPSTQFCIDWADTSLYRSKMTGFTLKFNRQLQWHTDSLMPTNIGDKKDMETVALHELGHAHLLKHSNNEDNVMYFTNPTPPYRRQLHFNDLEGGFYIIGLSIQPNALMDDNCVPPMDTFPHADCAVFTATKSVLRADNFEALFFPNPSNGIIYYTLKSEKNLVLELRITNLVGQVVQTGAVRTNMGIAQELDLRDLDNGIYLVSFLSSSGELSTTKIVVQR